MILVRAIGVAIGLTIIWQAIILIFAPPPFMLPTPLAVFAALRDRPDLWQVHAVTTLEETLIGLVAGTVLGAVLALAMSFLPPTRRLLLPVLVVSQAIPVFEPHHRHPPRRCLRPGWRAYRRMGRGLLRPRLRHAFRQFALAGLRRLCRAHPARRHVGDPPGGRRSSHRQPDALGA